MAGGFDRHIASTTTATGTGRDVVDSALAAAPPSPPTTPARRCRDEVERRGSAALPRSAPPRPRTRPPAGQTLPPSPRVLSIHTSLLPKQPICPPSCGMPRYLCAFACCEIAVRHASVVVLVHQVDRSCSGENSSPPPLNLHAFAFFVLPRLPALLIGNPL